MKEYQVINTFVERDEKGNPTGRRPQPGENVELDRKEAERLKKANCVTDIETMTRSAPERRGRKRGINPDIGAS